MEPKTDFISCSSDKLDHVGTTHYQQILGGLQYLTNTHPDISYAVSKMLQFFTNPMKHHWKALQQILRHISQNPFLGIWIRPSSSIKIEAFFDADWAGDLSNKHNHGGFVTYYGRNLISWQSKKQPTVARSSTEAEYMSITDAASEILWLRKNLDELGETLESSSILWCDSTNAQSIYKSNSTCYH